MTCSSCSSSPGPDDALVSSASLATGVHAPFPDLPVSPGISHGVDEVPQGETSHADGAPYGDPLSGLVHRAVADRPIEDVVRLITLLESSPEHAGTTADALRAAGLDRSVEDLARLITLLTRPPRGTDSAGVVIRAAAERRPLEDVTRLIRLLHRPSVEPRLGQAAVQAAAVNRPVEELAELIGRLAADRTDPDTDPLPDPAPDPGPDPAPDPDTDAETVSTAQVTVLPTTVQQAAPRTDWPRTDWPLPGAEQPADDRLTNDRVTDDWSADDWSAHHRLTNGRFAHERSADDWSRHDRPANDDRLAVGSATYPFPAAGSATDTGVAEQAVPDGPARRRPAADGSANDQGRRRRSSAPAAWTARGAALLVLLCGVANAPRSWVGLSQGVFVPGAVASGLCVLLALVLALPLRAALIRLGTAGAALGVGAALVVGQLLDERAGLPGPSRLGDVTLAPRWLAGTAAATTALAALVVLVTVLFTNRARRDTAG